MAGVRSDAQSEEREGKAALYNNMDKQAGGRY